MFAAAPALAADLELQTADIFVTRSDGTPLQSAMPPTDLAPVAQPLPYNRDLRELSDEERTGVQRTWLRMRFGDPRASHAQPLGVYIPRWSGNDARLLLNGAPLLGIPEPITTTWNTPVLVLLPEERLREVNELMVVVDSYAGNFLLTRPRVGTLEEIGWRYRARILLQLDAVRAISTLFAMLGLFSVLFWLRRGDGSYLLFALAALAWIMRLTQYYFHFREDSGWPAWLTVNSLLWAIALTYFFALSLSGKQHGKLKIWLLAIAVLAAVLSAPSLGLIDIWLAAPQINLFAVVLSVALGIQLSVLAYRNRGGYALAFSASLWISLALGAHDLLMQMNVIEQDGIYLLPYGAMLQVLTFGYAVQRRFADSVGEVEKLNSELTERVRATEERLKSAYGDLSRLEKQRAVDAERQRLMHEMHDGLGSTLMTSLAMAERGTVDQGMMAEALRECLQHLQLTVDSLEPMGGDLLTVLGTLRYRLGQRLEAAGVKLHWQAKALPTLVWMDAHAALHVLRIMQELLTNILKHSGASDIVLATDVVQNFALVSVKDNGRGFDVDAWRAASIKGRGLSNIERRVEQLRGQLKIDSGSDGTRVDLLLPIA